MCFAVRFVHTWMPEEADKLIIENMNKNLVDLDEYPAASIIHNRCISRHLFEKDMTSCVCFGYKHD